MNWDDEAYEYAEARSSEYFGYLPEQMFEHGAKWQRDQLHTDEAIERVAGLFSGWIGCPECAYLHGPICDKCKDFAGWAITALLGDTQCPH